MIATTCIALPPFAPSLPFLLPSLPSFPSSAAPRQTYGGRRGGRRGVQVRAGDPEPGAAARAGAGQMHGGGRAAAPGGRGGGERPGPGSAIARSPLARPLDRAVYCSAPSLTHSLSPSLPPSLHSSIPPSLLHASLVAPPLPSSCFHLPVCSVLLLLSHPISCHKHTHTHARTHNHTSPLLPRRAWGAESFVASQEARQRVVTAICDRWS